MFWRRAERRGALRVGGTLFPSEGKEVASDVDRESGLEEPAVRPEAVEAEARTVWRGGRLCLTTACRSTEGTLGIGTAVIRSKETVVSAVAPSSRMIA